MIVNFVYLIFPVYLPEMFPQFSPKFRFLRAKMADNGVFGVDRVICWLIGAFIALRCLQVAENKQLKSAANLCLRRFVEWT